MKRSLADELADLSNPAPTGLDDDDLGDGPALLDSDEDLGVSSPKKRQRRGVKDKLLLRGSLQLDAPIYQGKAVSSKAAFGAETSDEDAQSDSENGKAGNVSSDDNDGSEQPSNQSDNSGEEQTSGDDESVRDRSLSHTKSNGQFARQEGPKGSKQQKQQSTGGEESETRWQNGHISDKSMSSSSDDDHMYEQQAEEDDSELEDSSAEDSEASEEEDVDQAHRDQQEQEAAALARLKSRLAKDQERAQAVKNQHALWDKLLELRILLQKSLSTSYHLPAPQTAPQAHTESFQKPLIKELRETIDSFRELHKELCSRNSEIASLLIPDKPDRKPAELDWSNLESLHSQFAPFRDASLDKWYRKTLLTSGAGPLNSNLKIFNQSISAQVATMMQASEKVMRSAYLPVSAAPRKVLARGAETQDGAEDEHTGLDLESYTDAEFYQQLLKEFLESRGADPVNGLTAPKQKKRANTRDRKASKGRRLRYDVQEKLVNFMAAQRYEESAMAPQLFRNLFGQRTA